MFSLFDSINKETNLVAFKDGPMEYSGTFKFSEAADMSEQGGKLLSWKEDEKEEYEVEIVIEACRPV